MASRWARVLRGLLAAGGATFVAALFHVAGGGAVPSLLALAVSITFASLACIALAGRALALWRLVASVLLSQLLFHVTFSLSGSGVVSAATGQLHAGQHLVMAQVAGSAGMAGISDMAPDSSAMWGAHAAAAVLTVCALRFGERAFWRLYEFTAFSLAALMLPPVADTPRGSQRTPIATRPLTLENAVMLLGSMRHRGPPEAQIALG